MVAQNKKKIIKLLKSLSIFFKEYLAEIVFLVFALQLLIAIGALPYFNIINRYYYYVAGLLWIIANILFKKQLTNRKILIVGILMFFFAIPFVILDFSSVASAFGFAAFLILFTYIVRELFAQRDNLNK